MFLREPVPNEQVFLREPVPNKQVFLREPVPNEQVFLREPVLNGQQGEEKNDRTNKFTKRCKKINTK